MTLAQAIVKNTKTRNTLANLSSASSVCGAEAPGNGYFCTLPPNHAEGSLHLAHDNSGRLLMAWSAELLRMIQNETLRRQEGA